MQRLTANYVGKLIKNNNNHIKCLQNVFSMNITNKKRMWSE